jgi:hypothetical protein
MYTAKRLAGPLAADMTAVGRLVWLHDLNRWPFAHNSEKGFYDQSTEVVTFFRRYGSAVSEPDLRDLESFHRKALGELSGAGKCALLADMLTGIVEDPMMAVIGINVHPRVIPEPILGALGWTANTMAADLYELRREFRDMSLLSPVLAHFNQEFARRIDTFLDGDVMQSEAGLAERLYSIAKGIKETFLRPTIFPINNEAVCHSSWIKESIVKPFLSDEPEARTRLWILDEPAMLAYARELLGGDAAVERIYPDLDYVERERKDIVFMPAGIR